VCSSDLAAADSGQSESLQPTLHETADEIAAAIGVTRSAVHQHLTSLERENLVERRARASARGRPAHVFALTEAGAHVFPKRYDWFAELLLTRLQSKLGAPAVEAEMADLGKSLGARLAAEVGDGPIADRITAVAAKMTELGYVARVRTAVDSEAPTSSDSSGSDIPEIEAFNCVFHHLAARHPEVCTLDLALLDAALGVKTTHAECLVRGGASCRFRFKPNDNKS